MEYWKWITSALNKKLSPSFEQLPLRETVKEDDTPASQRQQTRMQSSLPNDILQFGNSGLSKKLAKGTSYTWKPTLEMLPATKLPSGKLLYIHQGLVGRMLGDSRQGLVFVCKACSVLEETNQISGYLTDRCGLKHEGFVFIIIMHCGVWCESNYW